MTPTLSQVRNWDTEHLTAAADHWTKTATVWEDRFTRYATHVNNPGGTPWEGTAADAAQQRAHSDRMTVIGLADQLHDASAIARSGAVEIAEACRLVLRSVDAAERAGFTVGEDFSVIDRHVYNMRAAAARQAQAAGFAADLRAFADGLASGPTTAHRLIKEAFRSSGEQHLEAQLRLEARLQGEAGRTPDFREAVNAFQAKRPPVFGGRR